MSGRTHARKIPQAEWNEHKDMIKDLYLEQNRQLQGSGGVIETMKNTHNFNPTKAQYESQFKKWRFSKNHSTRDWSSVDVIVKKRKNQGKDSVVSYQGEPIEPKKIRKEMSRYSCATNENHFLDAPTPPNPAGFSIQTPMKQPDLSHWFKDLPSSQLNETLSFNWSNPLIQEEQSLYSENGVAFTRGPVQDVIPLASVSNQVQKGVDSAVSLIKSLLPSPDFCDLANIETLSATSPEAFNMIYLRSLLFSTTNNFAAMTEHLQKTDMALLRSLTNDQISQLLSSMPEFGLQSFAQSFFKSAIMANDKRIIELLLDSPGTDIPVNDLVFAVNGHRFTAIELSSYQHNKETVFKLIEHGANVQKSFTESSARLMEFAMPTGALCAMVDGLSKGPRPEPELISALVEAGARITHKSLLRVIELRYGSLAEVIIRAKTSEQMTSRERAEVLHMAVVSEDSQLVDNSLELFSQKEIAFDMKSPPLDLSLVERALTYDYFYLVEQMLGLGAAITGNALIHAVTNKKPHMVQKLLSCGARITDYVIDGVVTAGDVEDVAVLLHQRAQDTDVLVGYGATRIAIRQGNCDMIRLLVSYGAPLNDEAVALASYHRWSEVVVLLLDLGADADSVTPGSRYEHTTAFGEALVQRNLNFAALLQRRGALRNITEEVKYRATIFAASEVGNVAVVEWLLKQGVSIKGHRIGPDFGRRTRSGMEYQKEAAYILSRSLSIAMRNNHQSAAHILLDAGARPYRNILSEALRMKDTRIVRAVLDCNKSTYSSLWSEDECEAMVEWAESAPLDEFLYKKLQYDPCPFLTSAIIMCKWNVVQQILVSGMSMNYAGCWDEDCDHYDCRLGTYDCRLGTAYELQDRKDHILLMVASETGNVSLVKQLLRMGADPCCSQAIGQREVLANEEMLHVLLEAYILKYKQPQKNYGFQALRLAIQDGDVPLVRLLISHKVDPNGMGPSRDDDRAFKTPLGVTISSKTSSSLEIAGILLEQGARPNSPTEQEGSRSPIKIAILMAISLRNLAMVQLLVNYGADVNLPATEGRKRTPLQQAAEEGDFDIVQTLLNNGAHVNDTPAYMAGGTPLQLAALKGYFAIVVLLLQKDADVNADPSKINGRTALEGAAEYGRIDTVQLLLNVGADINGPRGLRNGLAMELAEENGHFATLNLLRNYLASLDEQAATSPAVVDELFTAEGGALQMDSAVQFVPDDQVMALEWPMDAEFENTSSIGW